MTHWAPQGWAWHRHRCGGWSGPGHGQCHWLPWGQGGQTGNGEFSWETGDTATCAGGTGHQSGGHGKWFRYLSKKADRPVQEQLLLDSVPGFVCKPPERRAAEQVAHSADIHSLPVPEAGSPCACVGRSGVPGGLARGQQAAACSRCAPARPIPAFSSCEDRSSAGSGPIRSMQFLRFISKYGHIPGCWGWDCSPRVWGTQFCPSHDP